MNIVLKIFFILVLAWTILATTIATIGTIVSMAWASLAFSIIPGWVMIYLAVVGVRKFDLKK